MALDHEWVEIVADFTETVNDHLLFIRAVKVETKRGYKDYFNSRMMVLRTGFEDRLQLFFLNDVDENTTLRNFWPI